MKISNNRFVRMVFKLGSFAWGGDNTTSGAFGAEPFGTEEYGKLDHFKNRDDYSVTH